MTRRPRTKAGRLDPIELPSEAGERAGAEASAPPFGLPSEAEESVPAETTEPRAVPSPTAPDEPGGAARAGPAPQVVPERPVGWPETVRWPPDILANTVTRRRTIAAVEAERGVGRMCCQRAISHKHP